MRIVIVCLVSLCLLNGCSQSEKPDKSSSTASSNISTSAADQHRRLSVIIGGKTGYIDETGKLIINPQYDSAGNFSEGLAVVCVGECTTEHIIGHRYTKDFKEEAVEQSFKYGFIDESGKMVINPAFEEARNFSEGMAAVCVGQGCYSGQEKKSHRWGTSTNLGRWSSRRSSTVCGRVS
jgi:WG containing repeat